MKPNLSSVTLVCIDCTDKLHLAERAIQKSLEQCDFGAVKFLTHDATRKHAVTIPRIKSLEEYSRFMIRELHKYVQTMHALVVQWDGWVINGAAWQNDFLKYDYGGAVWEQTMTVGNGGFSSRSKKLLEVCASLDPHEFPHPEDAWVATHQRKALEQRGIKFMPVPMARQFAYEGRNYDGIEWSSNGTNYGGSFGFHSFLSPLPKSAGGPTVFHTSGDIGDFIYSLSVAKALGGGTYFVSPDCKHPYPKAPKCTKMDTHEFCNTVAPLASKQPYIWNCQPTHKTPDSTHVNFDEFRLAYKRGGAENWKNLLELHGNPWGVTWDGKPWLICDEPIVVSGKPIVVNKTQRYSSFRFPWDKVVKRYGHLMVFVGSNQEHELFGGFCPEINIPHYHTKDMWEVAKVVQGSKVCLMNQSACLAVAHGLGKNVIVDEWLENPNTRFKRSGALYPHGDNVEVPEAWLK